MLGWLCPSRAPRETVKADWPQLIPFQAPTPPEGWEGIGVVPVSVPDEQTNNEDAASSSFAARDVNEEEEDLPIEAEAGCMADLGRGRGVNARWARAAKHHLTNDWLVGPKDEAVTVEVVFTALPEPTEVSKHEFLTGERCDLYLLVDGRFRPVGGTQVTDEFGVARWEVKATDLPDADAVTPAAAVLRADNSVGRFAIYRITRPGVQIVCFDIDGTLTVHDDESSRQLSALAAGEVYMPLPFSGAVPTARFWYDQGYQIVYLSARNRLERELSLSWLTLEGFPAGPVIHSSALEKCERSSVWKCRQVRDWVTRCKAIVAAAYCNTANDELALRAAGVPSSRCYCTESSWLQYSHRIRSYHRHLKTILASTPPATVPAPRCTALAL